MARIRNEGTDYIKYQLPVASHVLPQKWERGRGEALKVLHLLEINRIKHCVLLINIQPRHERKLFFVAQQCRILFTHMIFIYF